MQVHMPHRTKNLRRSVHSSANESDSGDCLFSLYGRLLYGDMMVQLLEMFIGPQFFLASCLTSSLYLVIVYNLFWLFLSFAILITFFFIAVQFHGALATFTFNTHGGRLKRMVMMKV